MAPCWDRKAAVCEFMTLDRLCSPSDHWFSLRRYRFPLDICAMPRGAWLMDPPGMSSGVASFETLAFVVTSWRCCSASLLTFRHLLCGILINLPF